MLVEMIIFTNIYLYKSLKTILKEILEEACTRMIKDIHDDLPVYSSLSDFKFVQ